MVIKGHVAIDPQSELITATAVTPGNVGDGEPALSLLVDVLSEESDNSAASDSSTASDEPFGAVAGRVEVYGDASYGIADVLKQLEASGAAIFTKTQPPAPHSGMYAQDQLQIDTSAMTVGCPNGVVTPLRAQRVGGAARFGEHCISCPLSAACTSAKNGRTLRVHPKHDLPTRVRIGQADASWQAADRATRPKVERKVAHLMYRRHGARPARVPGTLRVTQDFSMLAATANLKSVTVLGVAWSATSGSWSSNALK